MQLLYIYIIQHQFAVQHFCYLNMLCNKMVLNFTYVVYL